MRPVRFAILGAGNMARTHAAALAAAAAIRERRSPAIPGREARRAVALSEGIYEAARTGRPVRLVPALLAGIQA